MVGKPQQHLIIIIISLFIYFVELVYIYIINVFSFFLHKQTHNLDIFLFISIHIIINIKPSVRF